MKSFNNNKYLILYLIPFLLSCSGLEQSEKEKIKRHNAKKERITLVQQKEFEWMKLPTVVAKGAYPWDEIIELKLPKITKEYFRCRGVEVNTPKLLYEKTSHAKYHYDCNGIHEHSLPLKGEKEFIYPILITLLNEIQEKLSKRVIITSGHRCPKHNLYCDATKAAQKSKHLIGAEVDFYVQGLEYQFDKVLEVLKTITAKRI